MTDKPDSAKIAAHIRFLADVQRAVPAGYYKTAEAHECGHVDLTGYCKRITLQTHCRQHRERA